MPADRYNQRGRGVALVQRHPAVGHAPPMSGGHGGIGGFLMSGRSALGCIGMGVAAVALAFIMAPVAQATPSTGSAQTPAARPLSANTCDGGGSSRGSGDNHLSNGTLTAGFCRYPAGGVGTVNIEYHKARGPRVTVQFAWEWVDTR